MCKILTKEQAAKLLDISVKTLELWVTKKFGPKPIWINHVMGFDVAEVNSFATHLLPVDKKLGQKKKTKV